MNKVNFINKTKKQLARLSAIQAPLPLGRGWGWVLGVLLLASCSDILDTSSELVEFQEDNTLDHPTDSVYSVMGIVNRMQLIADRSVLLQFRLSFSVRFPASGSIHDEKSRRDISVIALLQLWKVL